LACSKKQKRGVKERAHQLGSFLVGRQEEETRPGNVLNEGVEAEVSETARKGWEAAFEV
jgi:hypothetical protein